MMPQANFFMQAFLGRGGFPAGSFFFGILSFAAFIFWIWMLVDLLRRDYGRNKTEKLVWVFVVVSLNILGAVLYFVMEKSKK